MGGLDVRPKNPWFWDVSRGLTANRGGRGANESGWWAWGRVCWDGMGVERDAGEFADLRGRAPPDLRTAEGWQHAVESTCLASLLVVIESRLGSLGAAVSPEDVLQDALLHAWRARDSIRWLGYRAFRAWLLTVIDHRIADLRDRHLAAKRGNGKTIELQSSEDGLGGFEPAGSDTPSKIATLKEQAAIMRSVLERLPDELREIIRLRLFEQETLPRIAELLGLTLPTVEHRMRRGSIVYHAQLRAILARSNVSAPYGPA